MNSYDIDGVIYLGQGLKGLLPRTEDVIITGRSIEEWDVTRKQLDDLGVDKAAIIYMAPWKWIHKTRKLSGIHKAMTLMTIYSNGNPVQIHFEDDPLQADLIEEIMGDKIKVVRVQHNLVPLENVKHDAQQTFFFDEYVPGIGLGIK